ncbi:MAG: PPOX class F420-dependent oxidoreductase [Chloroflexi bacterium]|nr:PPOX class F420-dependent oxidoreductase [Chloroflexota bacterium]MCI0888953.1 PPOX class F420-dependent oxidoreductase [Chloroflexota bacterium]
MGVALSPEAVAFLHEKVYAHVATLNKDGSPQVTPVWVDTDGEHILINSSLGRQKVVNMQRDARVALSIAPPEDPHRGIVVRGIVKDITPDTDQKLINSFSLKYRDNPVYTVREGETRMVIRIEPLRVIERLKTR